MAKKLANIAQKTRDRSTIAGNLGIPFDDFRKLITVRFKELIFENPNYIEYGGPDRHKGCLSTGL